MKLKDTSLPIYEQIKRHISQRIQKGVWQAGQRLASENELVAEFGVSRMTVNRALRELTQSGLLVRVAGLGTFVAEKTFVASLLELRNIADEIGERGHRHHAQILSLHKLKAPAAIARQFSLPTGAELFHIYLLHFENQQAVQLEDRYVNPAVAADFMSVDYTTITPTEYLVNTTPVTEMEHRVEALMPTPEVRKLLQLSAKEPCLCLHRRTWSQGVVASCVQLIYPGSRYQLRARYTTGPNGRLNNS